MVEVVKSPLTAPGFVQVTHHRHVRPIHQYLKIVDVGLGPVSPYFEVARSIATVKTHRSCSRKRVNSGRRGQIPTDRARICYSRIPSTCTHMFDVLFISLHFHIRLFAAKGTEPWLTIPFFCCGHLQSTKNVHVASTLWTLVGWPTLLSANTLIHDHSCSFCRGCSFSNRLLSLWCKCESVIS